MRARCSRMSSYGNERRSGVIFLREKLLRGTPSTPVISKMAARLAIWFEFFRTTSNARVRVGGQQHAIDRQAAGSGVVHLVSRFPYNQRSDATQRRNRDIAPGIFLKPMTSTRHSSVTSIPHGVRYAVPKSNFSRRKITLRSSLGLIRNSQWVTRSRKLFRSKSRWLPSQKLGWIVAY